MHVLSTARSEKLTFHIMKFYDWGCSTAHLNITNMDWLVHCTVLDYINLIWIQSNIMFMSPIDTTIVNLASVKSGYHWQPGDNDTNSKI